MEVSEEKTREKIPILLEDLASLESYVLDLFAFVPLPICFVSPVGTILEFNQAFERLSGYESYDIIGEGIETFFNKEEAKELMDGAIKKGVVQATEIVLITKDRKVVPVSVFVKARRDKEGKIVGFFIGVFDLTEIKKTERELKEKVEELEKFQKIAVGRELKMVELKRELERLKVQRKTK